MDRCCGCKRKPELYRRCLLQPLSISFRDRTLHYTCGMFRSQQVHESPFLPPQYWAYKCVPLHLTFLCGCWGYKLRSTWLSLDQLSHLPAPPLCVLRDPWYTSEIHLKSCLIEQNTYPCVESPRPLWWQYLNPNGHLKKIRLLQNCISIFPPSLLFCHLLCPLIIWAPSMALWILFHLFKVQLKHVIMKPCRWISKKSY